MVPIKSLVPSNYNLRLIFIQHAIRPPITEEMMPDIQRLACGLSRNRFDATCPILNYDDLIAECYLKLSNVLTLVSNRVGEVGFWETPSGKKIKTRGEAFKYIKTVFNNHLKGLVAKHRLTQKRGHTKVDIDDLESAFSPASTKNVDASTDNADAPIQIADPTALFASAEDFIQDYKLYFTPVELAVIEEFNEPSLSTLIHAELDARRGHIEGTEKPEIKILHKHYAAGLGIEPMAFKKIIDSICAKIKDIKTMEQNVETQVAWNRSIALLEETFELQIPLSLDKSVVRRLLTLAAVDQIEKVSSNPEVQKALTVVGAKIPEKRLGHLVCFGIFFAKNLRTCINCGVNAACKAEAANYGLDDITLDVRLLGHKQVRIPTQTANSLMEPPLHSVRDESIYDYLKTNFKMQAGVGELLFKHQDVPGIVLAVDTRSPHFEVRVNRPTASIGERLERRGSQHFINKDVPAEEAVDIIRAFADEAFRELHA